MESLLWKGSYRATSLTTHSRVKFVIGHWVGRFYPHLDPLTTPALSTTVKWVPAPHHLSSKAISSSPASKFISILMINTSPGILIEFQFNEIKPPGTALGIFLMVDYFCILTTLAIKKKKMTFRLQNWPLLLIRFHGSVLKDINHFKNIITKRTAIINKLPKLFDLEKREDGGGRGV